MDDGRGSRNCGPRSIPRLEDFYRGQSLIAFLLRILSFVSSLRWRARKPARFPSIDETPGLGQSVPKRVLSAISSRRGKYLRRALGGMPLMSMNTFG